MRADGGLLWLAVWVGCVLGFGAVWLLSCQGLEYERANRLAAVRTCFFQFLTSLGTPVTEDLPFAVGRPRDDTQPPQVVTLREFDELTAHSGWLRTLYMLQPHPQRLFNYTGVVVGKGKSLKALSDMLAAQVARTDAHYQVSAVTVRGGCCHPACWHTVMLPFHRRLGFTSSLPSPPCTLHCTTPPHLAHRAH